MSQVVINLSYSEVSKECRLYAVKNKKILVSRDVKFDEYNRQNWNNKSIKSSKDLNIVSDGQTQLENQIGDDNVYDYLVRGTRSLDYVYQRCNMVVLEPNSYSDVAKSKNWVKAMSDEIEMINQNRTWHLDDRPKNQKVIGVMWVFKTKLNADGTINKYKAQLVAKGYMQEYGVDSSKTSTPVARHDTIRLLIALAAKEIGRSDTQV